jgi:hypothetical protein
VIVEIESIGPREAPVQDTIEKIVRPVERLMASGRLQEADLQALERGHVSANPDLSAVSAWLSEYDVPRGEPCLTVDKC